MDLLPGGPALTINTIRGAGTIRADRIWEQGERLCWKALGYPGCVVSVISQSLRLVQDHSNDCALRHEALKWGVHLVADLHQALHAIADERGGKDVLVHSDGWPTSLPRLWDGDLIDWVYPTETALQDQV